MFPPNPEVAMFKRLLVPLDRTALPEEALPRAAVIARDAAANIDLVLVHEGTFAPREHDIIAWTADEEYVARVSNALRSREGRCVSHCVSRGQPAQAICERARAIGADLIVMTTRGRTGMMRTLLGSVAHDVLRRTQTPVLMLKSRDDHAAASPATAFRRILVAHDGSRLAQSILPAACQLATCSGARLVLLRAVAPVPVTIPEPSTWAPMAVATDEEATRRVATLAQKELAAVHSRLVSQGFTRVESHVAIVPTVAAGILEYAAARQIDAIAMATHGYGASRLFLGSVADEVLRGSTVPVMLRRPVDVIAGDEWNDGFAVEDQLQALAGMHSPC